jgi:hypothetical protein
MDKFSILLVAHPIGTVVFAVWQYRSTVSPYVGEESLTVP